VHLVLLTRLRYHPIRGAAGSRSAPAWPTGLLSRALAWPVALVLSQARTEGAASHSTAVPRERSAGETAASHAPLSLSLTLPKRIAPVRLATSSSAWSCKSQEGAHLAHPTLIHEEENAELVPPRGWSRIISSCSSTVVAPWMASS